MPDINKELDKIMEDKTLGRKFDTGKPRLELIQDFAMALEQVAVVATIGAEKYDDGNWLHVEDGVKRYTGAMLRHFIQEPFELEDKDGFLHAAAVAWNALARLELMLRGGQ